MSLFVLLLVVVVPAALLVLGAGVGAFVLLKKDGGEKE
jgi:hypothetical protein